MEGILELKGLVMPSSYVSINDEEMEYVDGSWKWNWGAFLTTAAGVLVIAAGICSLVATCGASTPASGAAIAAGVLTIIGGAVATAGGICWLAEV